MRKFWQWNMNNTPAYWFAQGNYGKGMRVWVKGILIIMGAFAALGFILDASKKAAEKLETESMRDRIDDVFANYKHNHSKEGI